MARFDPGTRPDPDDRVRMLAAASDILRREGLAGLTVRKLAREAGCTTMTVYSRFGGKPGVLDALAAEGYAAVDAAFAEVSQGEGLVELAGLAAAWRAQALERPGHYRLMTGTAGPEVLPGPPVRAAAQPSLQRLEQACARAVEVGLLTGAPAALAHHLLATLHGLVSLELSGLVPQEDPDAAFAASVEAALRGWAA